MVTTLWFSKGLFYFSNSYIIFLEYDYTIAGIAISNGAIRGRNKEKRNEHER